MRTRNWAFWPDQPGICPMDGKIASEEHFLDLDEGIGYGMPVECCDEVSHQLS